MKIPITTEGTPFSTSSISRTNWLTRLLANSFVNMRDKNTDRNCDRCRDRDDDQRADDRIGNTSALALTDRELRCRLREEVEAERLESLQDDR